MAAPITPAGPGQSTVRWVDCLHKLGPLPCMNPSRTRGRPRLRAPLNVRLPGRRLARGPPSTQLSRGPGAAAAAEAARRPSRALQPLERHRIPVAPEQASQHRAQPEVDHQLVGRGLRVGLDTRPAAGTR